MNALKTKTTNPDEIAALERINEETKEIMAAGGHLVSGPGDDELDDKGKKKKKP
jgi:hypothetical protein